MQVIKKQTLFLATLLTLFGVLCTTAMASTTLEAKIPSGEVSNIPKKAADNAAIQRILNGIYQIAGVVAVIVIIIAGIRFITGGDSPDTVASARKAIIYACVGLVVVASAFVITNFIVGRASI